ncbi:MAG: hypothetical protein R3A13_05215 [Bdellovibrionota bacterium]
MIWESKSSTAHVGHDSSPALVTSISDAELLDKNSRGFQQVVLGAKRKFELKLKDLLLDSQQLPTLVLNNLNLDKLAVNPEEIGKLFGFFDKLVLEIPFNPEIVSDFACLKEAITTAFQFIELLDQGCELVTVSSERREQKPYSYLANAAGTSYPQTLLAVNQIADELNQYKQLVKTFYTTLSELAAEKASNCSSLDDSTKIENQERTKLEPLKAGWKEILSSLVLIGGAPFIAAWRVVKFTANCVRKALSATAKLFPAGIKFLSIPALAVSAPLILSREILKSTAKGLVKLRGGPLGLKLFDRDLLSPIENSLDFLSSRDARGLLKKLLDNPEKKGRIQGPEEFFEKLLVTEAYVLTGVDCKLVRLDAFLDSHGSEIDTASTKSALYKTYEVMSFEALKLRQRKGSAFHTTCTLPISEGEVSLPVPLCYKIIKLNFLNSVLSSKC